MELKFVNKSYFKQHFQNLRPKVQHSKNFRDVTLRYSIAQVVLYFLLGAPLSKTFSISLQPHYQHRLANNCMGGNILPSMSSSIKTVLVSLQPHYQHSLANKCMGDNEWHALHQYRLGIIVHTSLIITIAFPQK